MNFELILFKLRDEEMNAEKIVTVKNVSYCWSYEIKPEKIFRLVWDLNLPRSLLLSQKLKNYATPFVFSFLLSSSSWLDIYKAPINS